VLTMRYMNEGYVAREVARDEAARKSAMRSETLAKILPIKMSAYERVLLYLERISPQNLLVRIGAGGKSARMFRDELVEAIQSEFEHNLVQQLYIRQHVWAEVAKANEEMTAVINAGLTQVGETAAGIDLARIVIEYFTKAQEIQCQKAIVVLKADLQEQLG
jgi:hypothetical protein